VFDSFYLSFVIAATCFGLTAIIRELKCALLKLDSNKIVYRCLLMAGVQIVVKNYSV